MRFNKYFLALSVFSLILISGCASNNTEDILKINLREHKNIALHIHPFLEIEIGGQKQIIPANTGISGQGMRVIHTHDDTGKLHIEAPYEHQFYLKDFFVIWGKNFNNTCIFDRCVDQNHTLSVNVNGADDPRFGDIPLVDGDKIKIVYNKR